MHHAMRLLFGDSLTSDLASLNMHAFQYSRERRRRALIVVPQS